MSIPEQKIKEIVERTDLVALVSRHVELKKSGRSFKGRCPFHQERAPSFYVTPEMGRFKCFGCQAGGDAITFVQRFLGKSFLDAVRELAQVAGVSLEGGEDPGAREQRELQRTLKEADRFFHAQLAEETEGRAALAYLHERGLSRETIERFGLGWAPLQWGALSEHLQAAGLTETGVRAGLLAERARREGVFDVFRGRVMVPIRSHEGAVLGFGGRLLNGEGPPFLTLKSGPQFRKSDALFALDVALPELRRCREALLVLNLVDCMGLHQLGLGHAAAAMSTEAPPQLAQRLTQVGVRESVLFIEAGATNIPTAVRFTGALLAAGISATIAHPLQGESVGAAVRRGREHLNACLSSRQLASQRVLQMLLPLGSSSPPETKLRAVHTLREALVRMPQGLLRTAFVASASAHFGLAVGEFEAALGRPTERRS